MSDEILIKKENIISHKKGNISKEYTLGKTLGKGSFGQVRLAVHKATNHAWLKRIPEKKSI